MNGASDNTEALSGRLIVTSPFRGVTIEALPTHDEAWVERALSTAVELHRNRRGWLDVATRIEILERTAALMNERHEELAQLIALEGGKPVTDARVETTRAIDGVRLCVEHVRADRGHAIPLGTTKMASNRLGVTRKEPIGVVVAVSAFNHPLNLIVHQVAPAVAAGCPVIVKPAQDTPLSCLRFVSMLHEAGLPEPWCQALITDQISVAQALVTDARVGFFSFIGSARVGWMLRSQLAPGVRCALEHGGVAPVIVLPDADQPAAIASILKGGFYHAGQVCVSVQRVFVPEVTAETFARALANGAKALTVGDPSADETEVGPLIRPGEVERVHAWVSEAKAAGAQLLCGGTPLSETLYPPTVLWNPPVDAKVSSKEIFGPVVCVYGYRDLDEALAQANALPVAFQAAVFGQNQADILRVYAGIDASAVMVNDHSAFRDDVMPFAGLRHSGLGTGGIPYTLEDMQIEKLLVLRSPVL